MSLCSLALSCLAVCVLTVRCGSVPGAEAHGAPQESCASCGLRAPDQAERVKVDFVEAVKRHILNRLQMRDRPNITHPIPKAAMVTALRRLHAGKLREDGRLEIPSLDGQAAYNNEVQAETSEIISFAESGKNRYHHQTSSGSSPQNVDLNLQGSPQMTIISVCARVCVYVCVP